MDLSDVKVLTSDGRELCWNSDIIKTSLKNETNLADSTIDGIVKVIEEQVFELGTKRVTSSHIREFITIELLKRKYYRAESQYALLGLPLYDVYGLHFYPYKENSNQTKNPESINLVIAESILKQFALNQIFSEEVKKAHLTGQIHIHDLGMINRCYCGGHSVEYIKKYGLSFPCITSISSPAVHPEVLVGHILKASSVFQCNFAGAVGWEGINIFFAPLLRNKTYKEIKQVAQMLIYEFNQAAGGRGNQVIFSDINLYIGIPKRYEDVPVIAEGGKYLAKDKKTEEDVYLDKPLKSDKYDLLCYKDFEKEANLFLKALFEVYMEGDAIGKTFFFPKPLVHISEDSLKTEEREELFILACKLASKQGITYFVFDREDEFTISQCCRLNVKLSEYEKKLAKTPERIRFVALQNVTINLPRVAYEVGNIDEFYKILKDRVHLVGEAHQQKATFIKKLVNAGEKGVLGSLLMKHDGNIYFDINNAKYLCGIIGLNECVKYLIGKELHESKEAYQLGYDIIATLAGYCMVESSKRGIKIIVEETPAESAGERLVNLDLKYFPEETNKVAKGKDVKYYTNSIHFAEDSGVDIVTRIRGQSKMHPFIEAGAIIHVWLGEHEPDPKVIEKLVLKTLRKTECAQLTFSPEFTVCNDCNSVTRGLKKKCSKCNGLNVYGVTRIVGYFSRIDLWNKGKVAELKDRRRVKLNKENLNEELSVNL